MKSAKTKSGLSKLKLTYLSLSLAAVAICVGYGWYLYMLFRDARMNMPQPQIEKLTRDLRLFHSRAKRFPKNFNEINDLIWRTRPKPDYGADGRQVLVKNYRYLYTRVNDHQCAIWAIPLSSQRHYASTFFIVLSPDWMRAWKGRAMSDEEMAQIPAIPSPTALAELKMQEMPSHVFSEKK
ncbi:MAG: hypothetical protein ACREAB_01065 [Blastocatellia bacterium]